MILLNKGGLKYVIIAVLVLLLGTTGVILYQGHKSGAKDVKQIKYHCPMHPAYIADKPGDCPICGMKLVPMENKEEGKNKVMQAIEMQKSVTNDSIQNFLGVSDATATRYLDELEKEGKIKQVGKTGQGVFYEKV